MKYLILWQVTNWDLATSWHNGSATNIYVAYPYETYKEASFVAEKITNAILQIPSRENSYSNKYSAEAIVLGYDPTKEEVVNKFFKYKEISNSFLYKDELKGL